MAATARQKSGWIIANIVAMLLVLIPVRVDLLAVLQGPVHDHRPDVLPAKWTWANYSGIFSTSEFTRPLLNSIGIGLIATFISVVLASLAAYAVARLAFPGKSAADRHVAADRDVPADLAGDAAVQHRAHLGLFNTWPGLIIPYIAFGLPLGIYTLSAFFREIPWELEKAAKMDGATPFQAFVRVIAPLAAPGMVTTAILVFLFCWNEFLLAITLTSTTAARTAPAALAFFTGSSQFAVPTGSISAAAVVITIPIIIFVLFFQRRIVAGLTSGAVKG